MGTEIYLFRIEDYLVFIGVFRLSGLPPATAPSPFYLVVLVSAAFPTRSTKSTHFLITDDLLVGGIPVIIENAMGSVFFVFFFYEMMHFIRSCSLILS